MKAVATVAVGLLVLLSYDTAAAQHRVGPKYLYPARIRALIKKAPAWKDAFEINEAVLEVIGLTYGEVMKNNVSVQTQLAEALPPIQGNRVQLQQVILNLMLNAVDAMSSVSGGSRELLIGTGKDPSGGVLVTVGDSARD